VGLLTAVIGSVAGTRCQVKFVAGCPGRVTGYTNGLEYRETLIMPVGPRRLCLIMLVQGE
jgi:hypothetical protein